MQRLIELLRRTSGWLPSGLLARVETRLRRLPPVRRQIAEEAEQVTGRLESVLKPYRGEFPSYDRLPQSGLNHERILAEMAAMQQKEQRRWESGCVSGAVYHGEARHVELLNQVYALHSQSNPLHADLWPSATKFEAEIVRMTAGLLSGGEPAAQPSEGEPICGTVTSGGTESIVMAMKAYRDRARAERGIQRPRVVAPTTAHAAFDKAAQLLGMELVRVPVGDDCRADLEATARAINRRTILLIGSAPSFPHGVIDPIERLSELARGHGSGFHTDACLGGFLLPWAERLGYPVPPFDFRLPGVTSMSADTHKYGYAPKGTSVLLYREAGLRHYQYFTATEWPGGLYFSPTLAGSRPGGLIAACWAALLSMGEEGYLQATRQVLETATRIKQGIRQMPELKLLGDPLWVIAWTSDTLDIYKVLDRLSQCGWNLNGLHKPPALHLCVTLRHTAPGVAERFLDDLNRAVQHVQSHPKETGTMAPIYGMAATLPFRGVVGELLKAYIDRLYET